MLYNTPHQPHELGVVLDNGKDLNWDKVRKVLDGHSTSLILINSGGNKTTAVVAPGQNNPLFTLHVSREH